MMLLGNTSWTASQAIRTDRMRESLATNQCLVFGWNGSSFVCRTLHRFRKNVFSTFQFLLSILFLNMFDVAMFQAHESWVLLTPVMFSKST